ncbi:MAG: phosphoenolpyruvate--protein phosphotransferase [Neisseriaceae bacterium]|nr:phosphoenolpyruvate--protein phosphotransferase [Neisseriaceae bacterium]
MSLVLHGVPIGHGIAIGRAHLVRQSMEDVIYSPIEAHQVDAEIQRFELAIKATRKQMEQLRNNIPENAPTELGAFISLHLMLLTDITIAHEPTDIIKSRMVNAEWALKQQVDNLSQQFDAIDDTYLRERKQDMLQVVERVFKNLAGQSTDLGISDDLFDDTILVAHDLSPADTIFFKDHRIAAFVTDMGGPTSHTAILGRNLELPSVLALHNSRELIHEDDWIIVDGIDGVVIVQPEEQILVEYRRRAREHKAQRKELDKIKRASATTQDGTRVKLLTNIESADDIKNVTKSTADGVGLFRTEFLYLNRDSLPTEEEQYETYSQIVKKLKGKPVTMRTIDLGVDKNPRWFGQSEALNPALGVTGIRLCLAEPLMFKTQLRALIRASAHGDLHIMLPMISSVTEINQALTHINAVKQQLREEGLPFNDNLPIGAMIEIPSAALTVSSILKKIDFVSIGTNDLIQYTLAVDRGDEAVSYLYQPAHPAVLRLLSHVIRTANRMNKPVSVCGEMAGDAKLTRLLLGMGLRRFSMHPTHVLPIKQIIRDADLDTIEPSVLRIMRNEDPDRIDELLKKLNELSMEKEPTDDK